MSIQKISKNLRNKRGFTLVELMVVVVIIGILVAIAIPIYNGVQARAQESACFANQRIIDGSKQIFNMQTGGEQGTWPDDYFDDGALPTCPAAGTLSNTAPTDAGRVTCTAHAR